MSFLYKQYESLHKLRLPTVTVVQNTQMWNPRPLSFFILGLYPTPRPQNHSSKGEQPSQVAQQWVKNLPAMQETRRHGFDPWVGKSLRKRKWQPTPVFLHGKFYGQRSLVSYSPRGHKELDTIEQLILSLFKTTAKRLLYFKKGINCSGITEAPYPSPSNKYLLYS